MTAKESTRAKRTADAPYSVIVFKGLHPEPRKHYHADALAALTAAVEYLKAGYQARLSDGCVEWFAHQPVPDPAFLDAATADGQAAAFTGPPRIKAGKR